MLNRVKCSRQCILLNEKNTTSKIVIKTIVLKMIHPQKRETYLLNKKKIFRGHSDFERHSFLLPSLYGSKVDGGGGSAVVVLEAQAISLP